ncbi:MAG: hypothetical protein K6E21_03990 [Bacilli bacterium]|nr:hypothetical protein [Bacilli bacterium]
MNKYIFNPYSCKKYSTDPIFNQSNFEIFGDASDLDNPMLFEVNFNKHIYRYCLIKPYSSENEQELLLKIKKYIIINEIIDNSDNLLNTYFIGDMADSLEVSGQFCNSKNVFLTKEMIKQWYPKTLDGIIQIIIKIVFKKQKYLGEPCLLSSLDDDVLFMQPDLNESEKRNYRTFLLNSMFKNGLVTIVDNSVNIDCFVLTAKAVDSIENSKSVKNKDAFIAIKFDQNTERIDAIYKAIVLAGFNPVIMNRVETNNWIMPEIFDRIKKSRFVVADFSISCEGAYYEAGYAAALEKIVIHLFDIREENDKNKLHFDIAQKSTIFYKSFDDLIERLVNRIAATIK